jgi:hypothetical protein
MKSDKSPTIPDFEKIDAGRPFESADDFARRVRIVVHVVVERFFDTAPGFEPAEARSRDVH